MSIRLVLPWCRWPTIATFRTISGNCISCIMNARSNRVFGSPFSSTAKLRTFSGSTIGWLSGCVSSSCTSVSTSSPYTSVADG